MGRRFFPALLTILAAYADGRGSHGLAFDALLGAIPFAAVAALTTFGTYLDVREPLAALQASLWTAALVLLVLSCAARSTAAETHTLPALGSSALAACLGVFAVKAIVAAVPQLRRLALLRPAKP
ncbi:MAG TPA: hypothetical protein VFA97_03045 [Gaiellaceae bacterium]|nr:hypothetical protein [Gaiellaceae bacterium]